MHKNFATIVIPAVLVGYVAFVVCSPQQQAAFSAALSELSTLQQNKSLGEQFARDVKSQVGPEDPGYATIVEAYEDARHTYNDFIDHIEKLVATNQSKADLTDEYDNTQRTLTAFLRLATQALDPSLKLSDTSFNRAIEIPQTLPKTLHDLPIGPRNEVVKEVTKTVRWRSWRDL